MLLLRFFQYKGTNFTIRKQKATFKSHQPSNANNFNRYKMKLLKTALPILWLLLSVSVSGQSFSFSVPNKSFLLIPGGSVETKIWVTVPTGDSVTFQTNAGPGILAFFQPAVIYHSQHVYLLIISLDSNLAPHQNFTVSALCNGTTLHETIHIANAYDGDGFLLMDSARYWLDTAFAWFKHSFPNQKIFLNQVQTLPWVTSFPYPPLWIVTHHLFVSGNWRATVRWHNMVPPDNWEKIILYNEVLDSCYGVHVDSWGQFSLIPCDIMHYNYQDTITSAAEPPQNEKWQLWPNPAGETVYLKAPEDAGVPIKVILADITGRIILERVLYEKVEAIDISGLRPGVYFLMGEDDSRHWTSRLVIR